MAVVEVGLAPSLVHRRTALQDLLGPGFAVEDGTAITNGVVILDEASGRLVADTRTRAEALGIIVLLEEPGDCTPRGVVALIDAGADVCLVAPGAAGLAAHVRALAAHHPARAVVPGACLA